MSLYDSSSEDKIVLTFYMLCCTEGAAKSLATGPCTGRCSPLMRGVLREREYPEAR